MHRLAGLACVCFACSYHPPTDHGAANDAFVEPKLDAPPVNTCEPNTMFCNGRDRVLCNGEGNGAAETVTCPLTCLEATAQCYSASHISPTDQQACAGNPPTFMPTGNATIDINNGQPRISCENNSCGPAVTEIAGTFVTPTDGGPQIAMFCLRQMMIPDIDINVSGMSQAVALFTLQDVVIDGDINVTGGNAGVFGPGSRGASGGGGGDVTFIDNQAGEAGGQPCGGSGGNHSGSANNSAGGGGGGGGNLDVGGTGGRGADDNAGTTATGGAGGTATCGAGGLLAGGGGGGSGGDGPCGGPCGTGGGGGGGAMLIATGGNLQLNAISNLSADGGDGQSSNSGGAGGGGAGGTFVLEGKALLLNNTFRLRGGNGGSSGAGTGGGGADTTDNSGDDGPNQNSGNQGGAGGGGGAGRIHLRTPTDPGTICATISPRSQPSNVCTAGTLLPFP